MTTPDGVRRDPLLHEERHAARLVAPPARTAIGNSIRTLLLVGILIAIGLLVWWWRRPDDLTPQLGAREWGVVEVDDEPTPAGVVSTFVLDGDGEARSAVSCATSSGRWWFDRVDQVLELDWQDVSDVACPEDYPPTYRPRTGPVSVDDHVLTIETDTRKLQAIDLRGIGPASPEDFAGSWTDGELTLDLGRRGLATVDDCEGTWSDDDQGAIVLSIEEVSIERGFCSPPEFWTTGVPLLPVRFGDSLFLVRPAMPFPLDRQIVRLDREASSLVGTP